MIVFEEWSSSMTIMLTNVCKSSVEGDGSSVRYGILVRGRLASTTTAYISSPNCLRG